MSRGSVGGVVGSAKREGKWVWEEEFLGEGVVLLWVFSFCVENFEQHHHQPTHSTFNLSFLSPNPLHHPSHRHSLCYSLYPIQFFQSPNRYHNPHQYHNINIKNQREFDNSSKQHSLAKTKLHSFRCHYFTTTTHHQWTKIHYYLQQQLNYHSHRG